MALAPIMPEDTKLFKDVLFFFPPCAQLTRQKELTGLLIDNGAKHASLLEATHIITNSPEFEGWQSVPSTVAVVSVHWVERSLVLGKLQETRLYSVDPGMIFSGIILTTSEMESSDKEVVAAGINALGGLYREGLTKDCTHLLAPRAGSDKYNAAMHHKPSTQIKIVLPHWFDDCFRLMTRLKETDYEWPNPKFGHESLMTDQEAREKRHLTVPTGEAKDLFKSVQAAEDGKNIKGLERLHNGLWQGRTILLSPSLELEPTRRQTLQVAIERAGGKTLFVEGTDTNAAQEEEAKVTEADIVITKYRAGRAYLKAVKERKTIGTLAWLFQVQKTGIMLRSTDQILHYPVRKMKIEGFDKHVITITNYTGESREYIRRLILIMGARFTPTMNAQNTAVVAAFLGGDKIVKAREWSIPVVNHTWLEDCFLAWRALTPAVEKYITFPSSLDFTQLLGQRSVGKIDEETENQLVLEAEKVDARRTAQERQNASRVTPRILTASNTPANQPLASTAQSAQDVNIVEDVIGMEPPAYSEHEPESAVSIFRAPSAPVALVTSEATPQNGVADQNTTSEHQAPHNKPTEPPLEDPTPVRETDNVSKDREPGNSNSIPTPLQNGPISEASSREVPALVSMENEVPEEPIAGPSKSSPLRKSLPVESRRSGSGGFAAPQVVISSRTKTVEFTTSLKPRHVPKSSRKGKERIIESLFPEISSDVDGQEDDEDSDVPVSPDRSVKKKKSALTQNGKRKRAQISEGESEQAPEVHSRNQRVSADTQLELDVRTIKVGPPRGVKPSPQKTPASKLKRSPHKASHISPNREESPLSSPGHLMSSNPRTLSTRTESLHLVAHDVSATPVGKRGRPRKRVETPSPEREPSSSSDTPPRASYNHSASSGRKLVHVKKAIPSTSPETDRSTPPLVEVPVNSSQSPTRRISSRSAATKANQRLKNVIMPDVVHFEQEMRKGSVKAATDITVPKRRGRPSKNANTEDQPTKKRARTESSPNPVEPERVRSVTKKKAPLSSNGRGPDRAARFAAGAEPDSFSSESESEPEPSKEVRLLTTQVTLEESEKKILQKLGVKFATKPTECTHLVCNQLARTEKLLCAISSAPFILNEKWLRDSVVRRKLLPEDQYVLKDKVNEKKHDFNLADALARARRRKRPLLHGHEFYLTPHIGISVELFKAVVKSAGGKVLTQLPGYRALKDRDDRHVISSAVDKRMWQPLADQGITIHAPEVVLSGVLKQEMEWESSSIS